MTAVLVFVFVALTFFVSPYVGAALDRHRQARRELNRCGGPVRYTHPTSAPRFDRDPSPRARVR